MNVIDVIEQEQMRKDIPEFKIGDTLRITLRFKEITRAGTAPGGSKNQHASKTVKEEIKTQVYEGTLIARKNGGLRETITVRKISSGVGVEKTFMLHSPQIQKIEVVRKGFVRRAKLYYLRERTGKAARVKAAKINYTK
ncbi:MAG: 50S ribosomal protein L19 [Clostridia bacterium]|nr:50S ribosomal protein L19 [Clostridia bacterium]